METVSSSLSEFFVPGSQLFPGMTEEECAEIAEMRVTIEAVEEITRFIEELDNPEPLFYTTDHSL